MRKMFVLPIACLVLALILTACGPAFAARSHTFTAGLSGPEEHQFTIAMRILEEILERKTDGRISLQLHINSILGGEREVFEGVVMGSVNMSIAEASGVVPAWVKDAAVLSIPYLFPTREDAYDALDNFLLARLAPLYEAAGVKLLGFVELGYRHFTNNLRPIHSPADMEGMIIRVQEAPVWFALCEAVGAIATPISFSELYTALQQGVVDGQENPLGSIFAIKIYEVQRHLTLNGHTYAAGSIQMNIDLWDSLSAEDQVLIQEAINEMIPRQRQVIAERNDGFIAYFKDNGVQIVLEPDMAAFIEATRNIGNLEHVRALFDDPTIIDDVKAFVANRNR